MSPGPGIFRTKLPIGFLASGINCGVRRYRPDLGIIISEQPSVAAAVVTQNSCQAAPIQYCQRILPATNIKAIITNSGEANAASGEQGIINNQKMVDSVAAALKCETDQVLAASTGVIGPQLSIDKIAEAVPSLIDSASTIAEKFAVAILTTDLVPKTVFKQVQLSQGPVTITGICKGSGMIHPNMATMLGYLLTDLQLPMGETKQMLQAVCDKSFNMISVDGEPSTNDCVFMLANGMSGVQLATQSDKTIFYQALMEVAITLAKSIARDGEGASKLIEVEVSGAESEQQAKKIARSITTSLLIKTAIKGESPNWGRIIARIGAEGVSVQMLQQCTIAIQGISIFSQGAPVDHVDMDLLQQNLKKDAIDIAISFSSGDGAATAWGCDLTEKYVEINAEYLT